MTSNHLKNQCLSAGAEYRHQSRVAVSDVAIRTAAVRGQQQLFIAAMASVLTSVAFALLSTSGVGMDRALPCFGLSSGGFPGQHTGNSVVVLLSCLCVALS